MVRTPIPANLEVLDIVISENRRKEFYGVLVTTKGELYLISYDNYRLVPLPTKHFSPESMDFKLLVNPLYNTVVTSDSNTVRGIAMDRDYQAIRSFDLERLDPTPQAVRIVKDILFPFQLTLESPHRRHADIKLLPGGAWSLCGLLFALTGHILFFRKKDVSAATPLDYLAVTLTGFYGLIAVLILRDE